MSDTAAYERGQFPNRRAAFERHYRKYEVTKRRIVAVDFALLTSTMHMAWLRHIGGRLKSDYRYSIGLVYNTFPLPPEGTDLSSWSRSPKSSSTHAPPTRARRWPISTTRT